MSADQAFTSILESDDDDLVIIETTTSNDKPNNHLEKQLIVYDEMNSTNSKHPVERTMVLSWSSRDRLAEHLNRFSFLLSSKKSASADEKKKMVRLNCSIKSTLKNLPVQNENSSKRFKRSNLSEMSNKEPALKMKNHLIEEILNLLDKNQEFTFDHSYSDHEKSLLIYKNNNTVNALQNLDICSIDKIILRTDGECCSQQLNEQDFDNQHDEIPMSNGYANKSPVASFDSADFLTKDDLYKILKTMNFVTKDELNGKLITDDWTNMFITKDMASDFLTKNSANKFITKDEASSFLSKNLTDKFITKDSFDKFVTKSEFNVSLDQLASKFISKDDSDKRNVKRSEFDEIKKNLKVAQGEVWKLHKELILSRKKVEYYYKLYNVREFFENESECLSDVFLCNHKRWYLRLKATKFEHGDKFLEFYLHIDDETVFEMKVKFYLKLSSYSPIAIPKIRTFEHSFKTISEYGTPRFISYTDLVNSEKHFIRNDTIMVSCYLKTDQVYES